MNEHIDFWIDAYLDGELPVGMIHKVEMHLQTCQKCQGLLQEREELSTFLHIIPAAIPLKSEDKFLAELDSMIANDPAAKSTWLSRTKEWLGDERFRFIAWSAVSLVILLASLFFQTVGILSELISIIPSEYTVSFNQLIMSSANPMIHPNPIQAVLGGAGFYGLLDLSWLTNTIVLIVLSILNVVWLVVWLLRNPTGKLN